MKKIVLILAICALFASGRAYATCDGGVEFDAVNGETFCHSTKAMTWWAAFAWCQHNNLHLASLQEACDGWNGATGSDACPNMKVTEDVDGNTLSSNYMWTANPNGSSSAYVVSCIGKLSYNDRRNNVQHNSVLALCK